MSGDAQRLRNEAHEATVSVDGVEIHYERSGEGDVPLVLVHGSWTSHHDWDAVAARLA